MIIRRVVTPKAYSCSSNRPSISIFEGPDSKRGGIENFSNSSGTLLRIVLNAQACSSGSYFSNFD
jgi:hypothetical protein